MEITCSTCRQTWEVTAAQILGARLKFGLGYREHALTCPNCDAKNVITEKELESSDHPNPHTETDRGHPPRADNDRGSAPTNPVPGPEPSSRQYHGVVLERGLEVRREHNELSEIMGPLRKGEKVTILDTWTDGEDTWAQLGPERWVVIEQNGEALIKLTEE